MTTNIERRSCPKCGAEVSGDPDFVVWCQRCDWNVDPSPPKRSPTWLKRRAAKQSDRLARRLFELVVADPTPEKGGRWVSALTWLFAAAVHLVTVSLVAAAILVLVLAGGVPLWIRGVFAAILAAVAFYVQPFQRRRPSRRVTLSKNEAPELYSLVDEIARELAAPGVDAIEVFPDFNAAYYRVSAFPHQRRALGLGLTLWSVLEPQERVAIVGHELAHAVNGALRNARFVGMALRSLSAWRRLLSPTGPSPRRRVGRWGSRGQQGPTNLAERVFFSIVLAPLTVVIGLFGRTLQLLSNRQGQRREYYADLLAARIAGSAATVSATEKMLIGDICSRTLVQSVRFTPESDPWAVVRGRAKSVPPIEYERRRRLARLRLNRIDVTHPPTQFRADLLRQRPDIPPAVVMGENRSRAIDDELRGATATVTRELRDALGATA